MASLKSLRSVPTPLGGLALGIASLGACIEKALPCEGHSQLTSAAIAICLLALLAFRFVAYPSTWWQDIREPVVGSILPTFAMATMVVSAAAGLFNENIQIVIWTAAVSIHILTLFFFVFYRLRDPQLHHMVPSWFIPPVGMVVASVTVPNVQALITFAQWLTYFGIVCYFILLPTMFYRLIFVTQIQDNAKPTIAILAAPGNLLLAGYLNVEVDPSLLICAILFGVGLLMTVITYICFFRLLRLPFTPGYAGFTFPLVIGATSSYSLAAHVAIFEPLSPYIYQIKMIAHVELVGASLITTYVVIRYLLRYIVIPIIQHHKQAQQQARLERVPSH